MHTCELAQASLLQVPLISCLNSYPAKVELGVSCSPHFGVAHALCLGLAPWLAAEIPYMVENNVITSKS